MKTIVVGVCVLLAMAGAVGAVLISEVRVDQPGSDNDEYFELLGSPGQRLTNLSYVVIGDGGGGSGTIECVVDLSALVMPADAYLVVGESTFSFPVMLDGTNSLNFENSDNVTHLLVEGFVGNLGDDLDTDDDGVLDLHPWTRVVDGIALVEETNRPPVSTEWEYATDLGLPVLGPDGSASPFHVRRDETADYAWEIADDDPAAGGDTPGSANVDVPRARIVALTVAPAGDALRVSTPPLHATHTVQSRSTLLGSETWTTGQTFVSQGAVVDIPVSGAAAGACRFYRIVSAY